MIEYTPDTWEVKHGYVCHYENQDWHKRGIFQIAKEFDRWLAEHDAEIKEDERERTIKTREKNIETLNKHYENLIDLADLASRDADDDPAWYIERANTVQECIELVKKQVN